MLLILKKKNKQQQQQNQPKGAFNFPPAQIIPSHMDNTPTYVDNLGSKAHDHFQSYL